MTTLRIADAGPRPRPKKPRFTTGRKAEKFYMAQLRKVAENVGRIIRAFPVGDPASLGPIQKAMDAYADLLDPWAKAAAKRMLEDVSRRNYKVWSDLARDMGRGLRAEIEGTPIGATFQELMAEQIKEIKSIPLDAAIRVGHVTMQGMLQGTRASVIAADILRTEDVSQSRAMMIARTACSTANTTLTQARAQHIGSTGYFWETSRDGSVRESHKKMQGKFVLWSAKPVLDGWAGHAGEYANCRCWCRVDIPDWY